MSCKTLHERNHVQISNPSNEKVYKYEYEFREQKANKKMSKLKLENMLW